MLPDTVTVSPSSVVGLLIVQVPEPPYTSPVWVAVADPERTTAPIAPNSTVTYTAHVFFVVMSYPSFCSSWCDSPGTASSSAPIPVKLPPSPPPSPPPTGLRRIGRDRDAASGTAPPR